MAELERRQRSDPDDYQSKDVERSECRRDYGAINWRRVRLVDEEFGLKRHRECSLVIDDTVVERYGGEGVGYQHDTKHGLVKGHGYVTEVCSCDDVSYQLQG